MRCEKCGLYMSQRPKPTRIREAYRDPKEDPTYWPVFFKCSRCGAKVLKRVYELGEGYTL